MAALLSLVWLWVSMVGMTPANATSRLLHGESLLRSGCYEAGWKEYEWRQHVSDYVAHNKHVPLWDGDDLGVKLLLVQAEQGYGDIFQFARYMRVLSERRIEYRFAPTGRLDHLLSEYRQVSQGDQVSCRVQLMSLPFRLSIPLPCQSPSPPYITANPLLVKRWASFVPQNFSVGIAWSGNPKNTKDHERSFGEKEFEPLATIPGVSFTSLQHNKPCNLRRVIGFSSLDSQGAFTDTAAIIANLDLVICCDSAVAHLAGAMNRPVWVAIAHKADWRWGLEGERTPWYPSMRLFRQKTPGDWGEVFQRIASELRRLI